MSCSDFSTVDHFLHYFFFLHHLCTFLNIFLHIFLILLCIRREIGSENIITILSCCDDHTLIDGVEGNLLNILLPLVQEHQLRWDISSLCLLSIPSILNTEIPEWESVVCTTDCQYCLFSGLECNGGDGSIVPLDVGDGFGFRVFLHLPQVPHLEVTIICTWG